MDNKIPKIIHYCWFGGKPLPELAKKCIKSWEKYLPDYEIRRWDESNFDVNQIKYIKEAYEAKKYAFVSDYARFKILYDFGGLYFDTDVEVIKPMDHILQEGSFMGMESNLNNGSETSNVVVAPGLGLGVIPGHDLYKEILDFYGIQSFKNEDGTLNTTTVVYHTTNILKKHGLKNIQEIQKVAGITIYTPEYFCPLDYWTKTMNITDKTVSIHWYDASWVSPYQKIVKLLTTTLGSKFIKVCVLIKKSLRIN